MNTQSNEIPRSGEVYRHFKNKLYQIETIATHSETKEKLVIYRALYGNYQTYARPLDMFMSEVDRNKYPDADQLYRFEKVIESDGTTLQDKKFQDARYTLEVDKTINKAINESTDSHIDESTGESNEALCIMNFLDANTYKKKIEILQTFKRSGLLTKSILEDMAVSIDCIVDDGTVEQEYDSVYNCLTMLSKYECSRLR